MNTVPYASINVVEYAGPFPLMEFFRCYILQYFSPEWYYYCACACMHSFLFYTVYVFYLTLLVFARPA